MAPDLDLAFLTVPGAGGSGPELRVLTQSRTGPDGRALPGAFLRERTWAVSAAHALPLPESELAGANGELTGLTANGGLDGIASLLFDHDVIDDAAIRHVRERYELRLHYIDVGPDPDGFQPEPFTLLHLRAALEALIGEEWHKDNFARRMRPQHQGHADRTDRHAGHGRKGDRDTGHGPHPDRGRGRGEIQQARSRRWRRWCG